MAASNLNSIRRQVKNVAYNYSETQVKCQKSAKPPEYIRLLGESA